MLSKYYDDNNYAIYIILIFYIFLHISIFYKCINIPSLVITFHFNNSEYHWIPFCFIIQSIAACNVFFVSDKKLMRKPLSLTVDGRCIVLSSSIPTPFATDRNSFPTFSLLVSTVKWILDSLAFRRYISHFMICRMFSPAFGRLF